MTIRDCLISDFFDPRFQTAFRLYFDELGIRIRDWEGLFREMNKSGENRAYLRFTGTGFYLRKGYRRGIGYTSKNQDLVFIRDLA